MPFLLVAPGVPVALSALYGAVLLSCWPLHPDKEAYIVPSSTRAHKRDISFKYIFLSDVSQVTDNALCHRTNVPRLFPAAGPTYICHSRSRRSHQQTG